MGRHVTEAHDKGMMVVTVYEEGMNHKRIKNTRTDRYVIETMHQTPQGYEWGVKTKKYELGKKAINSQLNNKVKSS